MVDLLFELYQELKDTLEDPFFCLTLYQILKIFFPSIGRIEDKIRGKLAQLKQKIRDKLHR